MIQLETARLLLRPLQLEDAPTLALLWSDPDVTRYEGGPRKYDELIKLLEADARCTTPSDFDMLPVVEKSTGTVIGYCGLLDKAVDGKPEIELAYTFAKSAWGKGYATEMAIALKDDAFNRLGLERIISLIDPENIASQFVAQKVGMQYEKTTLRPGGRTLRVYAVSRS